MKSLIKQLFRYMSVHQKYWMAPLILALILVGGFLVLAQGSAVAPLLYAIF